MDQIWFGLGAVIGLGLVSLIFWLHWRVKKLESANLLVMEKLKDEKILDHIKALSDAELDALLSDDIQPGRPKN